MTPIACTLATRGFTLERYVEMSLDSPAPRWPDHSSTGHLPQPQVGHLRQYGYTMPSQGFATQNSSMLQHSTPYQQMPLPLGETNSMRRLDSATKAAALALIGGGMALSYTVSGLWAMITDLVSSSTGNTQYTPGLDISNLLSLVLALPIAAGLLAGGILFLRRKGYKTLLATTISQIFLATCNTVLSLLYWAGMLPGGSPFKELPPHVVLSLLGALWRAPFGLISIGFATITLILLLKSGTRQVLRPSQFTPIRTGQPHQGPLT